MDPHTGVLPGLKVMVDRSARWKFSRQQSPLAACPQEVKDGVEDGTKVGGARSATRSRRRQNWRNPGPTLRWSGRCRRIESAWYGPFGPVQRSFKTDANFSNTLLEYNQQARAIQRQTGPPREGPALLQGLVICGKCGSRMTLRYHQRAGRLSPNYLCQKQRIEQCRPRCQNFPGAVVDDALSTLIVQSVSPLALEVAISVQEELQKRLAESDRLRRQYVERAHYEAEQARIRYMRVDPLNRLVADTLEALWNDKLRQLEQAREDYEKQRESGARSITQEQKTRILALAEDFPRLWDDPLTSDRDRKRMARLILEDVTLMRDHSVISVQVRFKGRATKVLNLPMPPAAWQLRKTKAEILTEIDRLLERCTDSEVAAEMNKKGWRSWANLSFSKRIIFCLRTVHKLPSRTERLRAKGFLNASQIAQLIDSKPSLVDYWRQQGLLKGIRLNDRNEYLYENPNQDVLQQIKRRTRLKLTNHLS
jgi:hypothetical protein